MLIEKWEIRNATEHDLDYFLDAFYQIYNQQLDQHSFFELFKKKLKSQNSLLFVAQNTLGNIIGCMVCEKQESLQILKPMIQIKEFYISPKYRKFNLAEDMYVYIENKAIKMGVPKIEVLCNYTATTTQNFYLRRKFVIDRKSYIKQL
jgi:N-acetylglutamate synthase-like GNAT family acetyltransferase